jgi:hypothetical protein
MNNRAMKLAISLAAVSILAIVAFVAPSRGAATEPAHITPIITGGAQAQGSQVPKDEPANPAENPDPDEVISDAAGCISNVTVTFNTSTINNAGGTFGFVAYDGACTPLIVTNGSSVTYSGICLLNPGTNCPSVESNWVAEFYASLGSPSKKSTTIATATLYNYNCNPSTQNLQIPADDCFSQFWLWSTCTGTGSNCCCSLHVCQSDTVCNVSQ